MKRLGHSASSGPRSGDRRHVLGDGSCQAMHDAWLVRPWSAGRLDLLSLYLSRLWIAPAPTLTVCDRLIMIMSPLESFGLPWWRRGAAKLGRA